VLTHSSLLGVLQLNYIFGTSCISDFWPYGPPTCLTGTNPTFWAPGTPDYALSRKVMDVWGSFLWYSSTSLYHMRTQSPQ
jgi:hypothetical protein